MSTFKNTEEARIYFQGDRFATLNGMQLDELTEDMSVCSMTLGEGHKNANGGIMGGVMFTLADLAFAALANNIHKPTVAQQVSINYLSAPKGTRLIARATCKKDGRSTMVINVEVSDDTGREIAQFVGTGFKL
ncbi:MAG: PaaI family thioesterase [Lachnospiraceae bacterium]|nr:PaaI family thioesterase [Lachnospiraceae bacterium]